MEQLWKDLFKDLKKIFGRALLVLAILAGIAILGLVANSIYNQHLTVKTMAEYNEKMLATMNEYNEKMLAFFEESQFVTDFEIVTDNQSENSGGISFTK